MFAMKMKRHIKSIIATMLFAFLLSCAAFASEEAKEYIVFPKITLFSNGVDSGVSDGGFVVVGEAELSEMLDAGIVEWYEENYEASFFEADTNEYEWQFDLTGAEAASEVGCFGQGVRVALIDSGIDADHPAFKNADVDAGWNYAENNGDVTDMINHGTSVAGMIVATTNRVRVDSLAPKVELVPIKCVSGASESIKMDDLCNSIYGAINDFDCDVINLSLGLSANSTALQNAIAYAEEKGVIVVAAVGNNATGSDNALQYPAAYEYAIGVGSVGSSGAASYFSRINESVFILAPGERVLTSFLPEQDANDSSVVYYYGWGYGTSMASPMVAATAAVLKNAEPNLTAEQFKDILSSTATQSEADTVPGYDTTYGHGILNCENAMKKVLEDVSVFVSPTLYDDAGASAYVCNNLDKAYSGYLFAGEYESGVPCNMWAQSISLASKEVLQAQTDLRSDVSFFNFGKTSGSSPIFVDSVSFAREADREDITLKVCWSSTLEPDDISVMLSGRLIEECVSDTASVIHIGKTENPSGNEYEATISPARLRAALGESCDGSVVYVTLGSRSFGESRTSAVVFTEPTEDESVALSATVSFAATSNIGSSVSVSGIEYNNPIGNIERGSEISVSAPEVDGYVFRFWKRGSSDNGSYVSSAANYSFKLMTHTYLTAVYDKIEEDKSSVEFFNGNGELVDCVAVETGARFSDVEPPEVSLTGYDFVGWSAADDEEVNGVLRTVALYEEKGSDISGTVTVNGKEIENVSYGDAVESIAQKADFTCWKRDEKIVSYSPKYTYYVWDGTDIAESTELCTVQPIVLLDDYANGAFMIEYDAGGKEIVEVGILFGSNEKITVNSCGSKSTSQRNLSHGQFTAKPAGSESFARGYMIYKSGNKFGIIYSDTVAKASSEMN